MAASVTLVLPAWVEELVVGSGAREPGRLVDDHARMGFVLSLARENVVRGDGGPFGAAVFDVTTGSLVAAGVNLVVASRVPIAHAEVVALAVAGPSLGSFDLGVAGPTELVTSCEPCAMCLGAVPWSGVARVVAGARDEDARSVGFDEGDKPADWAVQLRRRGIDVVADVRRAEATDVLRSYVEAGGYVYNGARGSG
jgi:tRNA(Arg) A34 adenosine deaminase TadA